MSICGQNWGYNLRFDKHVSNICLKANRKLSALTIVAKYVHFKKRHVIFKAFIESQFNIVQLYECFIEGKPMIR